MKIFYSPECLKYSQPGHPESPARVSTAYEYLKQNGCEFTKPQMCSEEDILLAHSPELLASVKDGTFMDFDTPNYPGIYDIARLSAGGAIAAAKHCLNSGEKAFSLMRPPGHHATGNQPGGFCYFNSIAIACLKVQKQAGRIAIIDFDCHHGNGTEDIMMGRQDILYVSHHQSPLYPGTGLKTINNCLNFPLHSGITPQEFLDSFRQGMRKVTEFKPDMLAISAGFDSYRLDPITNLSLEQETYREIGNIISTLQKPAFAILEGGYSSDLGECVHQFLLGLEE